MTLLLVAPYKMRALPMRGTLVGRGNSRKEEFNGEQSAAAYPSC